jgi:short chain dehydrogenase
MLRHIQRYSVKPLKMGEISLFLDYAMLSRITPRFLLDNASTFERDGALDATRASWDLHLESNLRAPFVLIQHFARQLEQGAEGNVINVIDERVWNLTPHFVSYTVSKAALWILTQRSRRRSASMRSGRDQSCRAPISRRRASVACAPPCPCNAALRPRRSAGRFTSSWRRPR